MAEVVVYSEEEVITSAQIAAIFQENEAQVDGGSYITIQEKGTLKTMEAEIIRHLLSRYSAEEVCYRLGISRVTLWRKMK